MKIETNGISLEVAVEGEGDAVLLLHGFPDTHRLWKSQVPALVDAGYRTVAPDMRGFGDSEKPEGVENYFILHATEDLKGVLDELGIDRVHVVGHDWGSATAWVFASLYPDRVASLTAISVGHPAAFQGAGFEQYARSWYMFMFQFEGVAEQWISRNDWEFLRLGFGGSTDVEERIEFLSRPGALTAALNWYRANVPPQSWISEPPALPPIAAPTMAIWSSGDVALGEDQMTGSQKHVTGPWRYERIEDVGHWVPTDAAERLNELLIDFLASV
ncbi:MAG TPA: alpha/beta fold hydrolase [Actinomycetota bacterium]|nr:alpha/beta fold hydrolase [Actinomycetota bacterium]